MSTMGRRGEETPLRSGGAALRTLAAAPRKRRRGQRSERYRYWVSGVRPMESGRREILEISFGGERLINHLSFAVSRLPLVLRVEYLDRNGDWQAVTHNKRVRRKNRRRGARRTLLREPVRLTISNSVPGRVDSAQARNRHPRHFGRAHWMKEAWRINPVRTRKIRFVIVRNRRGVAPRNPRGKRVPYSVAIRHLTVGYRATSAEDLPRPSADPWWASGKDILGSQVVYSTYTQPADRAIDGDRATFWRSEPQPFPFAVTAMYLDLRDMEGNAPTIDRFWMDPITTGVMCNLYYSNTVPNDTDFDGLSDPIPPEHRAQTSAPVVVRDEATSTPYALDFGPDSQTGVQVSHLYTRIRYDRPWWVGLDARLLASPDSPGPHPILSVGTTQILQQDGALRVLLQTGAEAILPLDPERFRDNTRYTLVVAYHPDDPASQRPPYVRLSVKVGAFEAEVVEVAVPALPDVSSPLRIGLHPDPADTSIAAMSLHGLVVKSEALTDETEEWFHGEGEEFVGEPEMEDDDRDLSFNARLRVHPQWVTPANPFGVVGGSGDRYGEMEWTPVTRDYVLRQGYMNVPPTKAAFWKFEMTGLVPQVYENLLTIDREVLVFPPEVVRAHQNAAGPADEAATPSGVATNGNVAQITAYSDVLSAVRRATPPADSTKALVIDDPTTAEQAASTGWIWTYQPWHVGSSAPQFIGTRVHQYESLEVRHSTKVAYFAGIREVRPYRTNYSFDDDTPEYIEHFHDTAFLDLAQTTGVEHFDGGVRAFSSHAQVTSQPLRSYRNVRGVQFATTESDSVQVLTDPDFFARHLDFWEPYGDATLDLLSPGSGVDVRRGWFSNTYRDLEQTYATYGDMDGVLYARLEGNNLDSGSAEGGIVSETYTPTGAGKIRAVVRVSAGSDLRAPIVAELVTVFGDKVVAQSEQRVRAGETEVLTLAYAPDSLIDERTYGEVETMVSTPTTYGELETSRYFQLESESEIPSDVYVRVRQQGPTDDTFSVQRIGLYDSPVAWYFSNDDGATWWQAIDVRNNPHGVLIFPESMTPETPGVGTTLRWRAKTYRENASISAIHIRPWYGSRERTVARAHGLDSLGPNQSLRDVVPATHQHPMWQDVWSPIEHTYTEPVRVAPLWRNLAIMPGGEWPEAEGAAGVIEGWDAEGGTIRFVKTDGSYPIGNEEVQP